MKSVLGAPCNIGVCGLKRKATARQGSIGGALVVFAFLLLRNGELESTFSGVGLCGSGLAFATLLYV